MLGDDHTCEKKRTFWTTRTSRTMSPDDKTASGLIQKSLDVLMVDRSGYLDSMVMPATPASPMFYASAQGDRILSPGRPDPDYPPFPNHGWAVFTGRMPTNGSSWHAGWPDPMGKGATPRWMSAGWGECLRGHWPQGAPPHLCIVGPDGACCVASQYGQLRPGRGQRALRAMLPRPQLTLVYQIPVVLPELARAGDEPWPSLDGHGSWSGIARLPRRVTATSGSDPKVPGGDVPPI